MCRYVCMLVCVCAEFLDLIMTARDNRFHICRHHLRIDSLMCTQSNRARYYLHFTRYIPNTAAWHEEEQACEPLCLRIILTRCARPPPPTTTTTTINVIISTLSSTAISLVTCTSVFKRHDNNMTPNALNSITNY